MKPVLVCLHGWGGSQESFTQLCAALKGKDIGIHTLDLPGFGKEPEPKTAWELKDYVQWTEKWIHKNVGEKKIHLLGHSFGGQIAAVIAAEKRIKLAHLYLCAPAIVRSKFGMRRAIGYVIAKTGRAITAIPGLHFLRGAARGLLYKLARVHDYERASPLMQKILTTVTRQPVTKILPMIKVPTDIFWGNDDRQTHIREAAIVHKGIQGSTLHTYKGVRHGVHRDKAREIADVITARIGA